MTPKSITERLTGNDRAVSPVIGVILMVAITVILAAVIGTFVLDLGQSAGNSAPSASLTVTVDQQQGYFNVSHKGGDSLNAQNTRVIISNSSETITYDSDGSSDSFGVGETKDFYVNDTATGSATVSGWALSSEDGPINVASGEQYDIQFIDTESQRVIFETTVTA